MQKKQNNRLKCAICNMPNISKLEPKYSKVCLNCYLSSVNEIPHYVPFEQHDLWIVKNNERSSE